MLVAKMKRATLSAIPTGLRETLQDRYDTLRLNRQSWLGADYSRLIDHRSLVPQEIFANPALGEEWSVLQNRLADVLLTKESTGPGGVNPGDGRALYYLIRHLKPTSILEIGTHVGVSTVHIAAAMQRNAEEGVKATLTSCDIADVNDLATRPWEKYGFQLSPRQMIDRLGASHLVEFIVGDSMRFLDTTEKRFGFAFLDGNHAGKWVYNEVQRSQRVLLPDGVILLHDYFPQERSMMQGDKVIPGPWRAVQRLRSEGAPVTVTPLGKLPWATKSKDVNVTTLALLGRE